MGWLANYNSIKKFIESEEFKKENRAWNPNDPQSTLAIALRELYNDVNPWGHKL